MAEFVEILSPKAKADLEQANAELVKMLSNMKAVNSATIGAKTPSGSDSALKSLTAEYDKQQKIIISLQKELQKLADIKQKNNVKTSEEIVNQRTLAQNADRQTRATSALVGAYANLNAKHQQVAKSLQDLIVRGRQAGQTQKQYNREVQQAQKEFNTLNQRIIAADRAVGRFNRNVGNYPTQAIRGIRDLIGAFGIVGGVSLFAMVTKDIISTGKELQGLNNALMLVTETQANFAEQQQFLQRISEAYGLEIKGLTQQFTQFYVSAKDKVSGREIQQIFESVSKAGAAMGLSVQQQERAFLALNQMMSKGSIQAEELRGQLGEALPGAFGIMAKAVGVTEQELGKMMKAGELLASDVLPKFAKQLEITYGIENINRIETMTTATNRLSNAWTKFVETITSNDGIISKSLIGLLNILSDVTDGIRLMTMSEKERDAEVNNNVIEKRVSEYKTYLGTLDLTNKAVLEEQRLMALSNLERNKGLRQEIENLKNRRSEIIANQRTGGIGANDKEELANIERKIKGNSLLIPIYIQEAEALDAIAKEQNKATKETDKGTESDKEATTAKREKIKVIKEERDLIVGSVEWLEKEISILKEKQNQLSTTTDEYQKHQAEIQTLIGSLEILTGQYKKLDEIVKDTGVAISEFDLSDEGVEAWYNKMAESFQKVETDWIGIFDDWAGVAMQSLDLVSQAQDNEFVKRMNQLEKERDLAIQFAGDSAEAKAEIDRQYEAKRLVLEKKRFEQEKRSNIIRAIIDTAGAVIQALPNIPLSIAVGALGAIQLGIIASQQYPEFYKGTEDAPEGWAWTQERGREIITDKQGKIKSLGNDKGATKTYLNKGDKVFTAQQSEAIMFNSNLNSILENRGVLPSTIINGGLSKSEFDNGINQLANVIKNKSSLELVKDRRGERIYEKSQGMKKELVNNRLKVRGYDI
jgi:tape measure domain-containing protein